MVKVRVAGYAAQCEFRVEEMARTGYQATAETFQISRWTWDTLVSLGAYECTVEIQCSRKEAYIVDHIKYFPTASFSIDIIDTASEESKLVASTGDVTEHRFSPGHSYCFAWDFEKDFPSTFCVKIEFEKIRSAMPHDKDGYYFDGYDRRQITRFREMRMSGTFPDLELTLPGNRLRVHSAVLESKAPVLYRLFSNGVDTISMDNISMENSLTSEAHSITNDVLNAFIEYLYDSIDDDDLATHATGLLELARCYLINDLRETISKRLARDINTSNCGKRLILATLFDLEEVKKVCKPLLVHFKMVECVEFEELEQDMIDQIYEMVFEEDMIDQISEMSLQE